MRPIPILTLLEHIYRRISNSSTSRRVQIGRKRRDETRREPGPLLFPEHLRARLDLLRNDTECEDSYPRQPRSQSEPPRQVRRNPVRRVRHTRFPPSPYPSLSPLAFPLLIPP